MDWLIAFDEYVPLFQTLVKATVFLAAVLLVVRSDHVSRMLDSLGARLSDPDTEVSAKAKAFGVEIDAALKHLPMASVEGDSRPKSNDSAIPALILPDEASDVIDQLKNFRDHTYETNRHLVLVHSIAPSSIAGQDFDIFIYLQPHRENNKPELYNVESVDFYFGRFWGSQVFHVAAEDVPDGVFGIRTSAYGSFLCACLIRFNDGQTSKQYRYIDFSQNTIAGSIS